MLLSSSGFVCICPPKSVELGQDSKLHRADHQAELHEELEFSVAQASTNTFAYLPGGGVRAINPNSSMTLHETETCIAVFKGNLTNKAQLAVCLPTGSQHVSEAELLIKLYAELGLDMLGRLDGHFAFCLYDSKQARVLAARSPSGEIPLLEGRSPAGSLIIACGTFMPEGAYDIVEIGPGQLKYGWHALPRNYHAHSARQPAVRASLDYGIRRRSLDAYKAPALGRQSLDAASARFGNRRRSMDYSHSYYHRHADAAPSPNSLARTSSAGAATLTAAGNGAYVPPHIAAALAAQQQEQHGRGHMSHRGHGGFRRVSDAGGCKTQIEHRAAIAEEERKVDGAAEAAGVGTGAATPAKGSEPPHSPGSPAAAAGEQKRSRHRRRRRRHSEAASRSGSSQHASGGDAGSDAESMASCSTHDSVQSGPHRGAAQPPRRRSMEVHKPAGTAGGISADKQQQQGQKEQKTHSSHHHQQQQVAKKAAAAPAAGPGTTAPAASPAPAGGNSSKHHHRGGKKSPAAVAAAAAKKAAAQVVEAAVKGFKRNGSCGDLVAAAAAPGADNFARSAALQGLAC